MGLKAQHRQQVAGKGAMHERKEEGSAHREDRVPPPHGKNIHHQVLLGDKRHIEGKRDRAEKSMAPSGFFFTAGQWAFRGPAGSPRNSLAVSGSPASAKAMATIVLSNCESFMLLDAPFALVND